MSLFTYGYRILKLLKKVNILFYVILGVLWTQKSGA